MGSNPSETTATTTPAKAVRSVATTDPAVKKPKPAADGQPSAETAMNLALIVGQLVAEPESRSLPSGSVAVSFSVTVRTPGAKTTSVPAVWYDPPKRVHRWAAGDTVIAQGSVVRRFFQTGGGLASATEVVVERAELTRHHGKAASVLQRTAALLFQAGVYSTDTPSLGG